MHKSEKDILSNWEKSRKEIYFYGAGERSIVLAEKICNLFPSLNLLGVIDNFIKQKYIIINNKNIPIYTWEQINENAYIILCIPRRSSYFEIRRDLMNTGFQYGENYVDGYAVVNEYADVSFGTNEFPYENLRIGRRYAPWRIKGTFNQIYMTIKENTLVDIYRCYELWELVFQTAKCSEGEILEVGVWRGGTGALIAKAAIEANIVEVVSLCDTFEGVVKCSEADNLYKGKEHNDTSIEIVEKLLQALDLKNTNIYKGVFPDDLFEYFNGKKYRFVHIDVDVYQSAKDVFKYIWENVVQGGVVIFDDYGFASTMGVTKLLDDLKSSVKDGIFCSNVNGHGYFIKV